MGSGVGSGWDPVGSGVKKWDPGGFKGVFFRRKRWDPIRPAQGFIILKAGTHLWQLALSAPWRLLCNFFVEFYQPSGKNFLIFPSLVSDFCENPNERQTRSCLSQTGAGFLFHLDSPSWPVPPLPAPPASRKQHARKLTMTWMWTACADAFPIASKS